MLLSSFEVPGTWNRYKIDILSFLFFKFKIFQKNAMFRVDLFVQGSRNNWVNGCNIPRKNNSPGACLNCLSIWVSVVPRNLYVEYWKQSNNSCNQYRLKWFKAKKNKKTVLSFHKNVFKIFEYLFTIFGLLRYVIFGKNTLHIYLVPTVHKSCRCHRPLVFLEGFTDSKKKKSPELL